MTTPSVRNIKDPKMAPGEVSPKVTWPAIALLALGIALVVLHFVVSDPGNDTFLNVGLSLIGASGLVGGIGYSAKVGRVQVPPLADGGTTYRGQDRI